MATNINMQIRHFDALIDGKIIPSSDNGYFESTNPSIGEVFATVTNATKDDVNRAIASAKKSFDKGIWRNFSLAERGVYLKNIAKLIREHAKELAELESLDTGKTLKQTTFIDVPTCADSFEYFSHIDKELAAKKLNIAAPVKSTIVNEPMGVVACIFPWNYPLIYVGWKLAPALMAGNSVILKPSSKGCVSVMRLAQIIAEAGLPDGVVNIVATTNHDAVKELIKSPNVKMISFTGGTETGQEIMRLSSNPLKKLTLELGGKSPNIVFDDCDMEAALGGTMSAIFMNQGQMCTAGSRLLLQEKIYDEFLSKLLERTKKLKIGNAINFETEFGPVISAEHREHLLKFIEKGLTEKAKLECGGKIPQGDQYKNGYYLEPTIFSNVINSMYIAQHEAFGPILSVIKFTDLDEAIKIANDSAFGLAACVWTKDESIPAIAAKELKCGTVWINTYGGFYNEAPFGGYKQSGFGRELGVEGLLEYTQTKHICIDQTPGGMPLVSSWF